MPKPIQAVIFDQDGLMFGTESLTATSRFEIGPEHGVHMDGNFLRGVRGYKPDKVKQVHAQQFSKDTVKDYGHFREEKRQCSYRWIAQHGVPIEKDFKELLICPKGRSIETTVTTANSENWTQSNIRGTGVGNYFDGYVYGDMVKETKPNPAIFLLVAQRLGVGPEVCVVLEDSFNGIEAAAAGGFNPVMIPDQDQPDEEIRKLLVACCDSLTDAIGLFETGRLPLQRP